MRYLLILFALQFVACAHVRQTCDMYCLERGGQCDRVEQGWTVYNTVTHATEEQPTRFVCKYNW